MKTIRFASDDPKLCEEIVREIAKIERQQNRCPSLDRRREDMTVAWIGSASSGILCS